MVRVLLTSFEPFGGHGLNSSLEVGRAVADRPPPDVALDWLVLPVVAGLCVEQAWSRARQTSPTLVLLLGQAAGTPHLRIEERAVNANHFPFPDNAGNLLQNQVSIPCGPAAYRATVPAARLLRALRGEGVAAELSGSAGTYVCNYLFYNLLHRSAVAGLRHQTGFLHLPLLPNQVDPRRPQPSRDLAELADAVRRAIRQCVAPGA
jgi:pyroglutamyl-peptidase